MRAAPSVSVKCQGGVGWLWLQAGLPALTAAAVTFWILGWAEASTPWAAVGAICAGTAVGWMARRESPPVVLAWDGDRWTADGGAGALEVAIDLGVWLLLRLRPEAGGPARWIAVSAGEAGAALHGLRAAAYARSTDAPRSLVRVSD
jgi:hypothetical protein